MHFTATSPFDTILQYLKHPSAISHPSCPTNLSHVLPCPPLFSPTYTVLLPLSFVCVDQVSAMVNDAAKDVTYYMTRAPLFEYTLLNSG